MHPSSDVGSKLLEFVAVQICQIQHFQHNFILGPDFIDVTNQFCKRNAMVSSIKVRFFW